MCAPACRGRGRVVGRHTDRGGSGTHMGPTTRTTRDHMQSKHSHHLVSGLDGTVFVLRSRAVLGLELQGRRPRLEAGVAGAP